MKKFLTSICILTFAVLLCVAAYAADVENPFSNGAVAAVYSESGRMTAFAVADVDGFDISLEGGACVKIFDAQGLMTPAKAETELPFSCDEYVFHPQSGRLEIKAALNAQSGAMLFAPSVKTLFVGENVDVLDGALVQKLGKGELKIEFDGTESGFAEILSGSLAADATVTYLVDTEYYTVSFIVGDIFQARTYAEGLVPGFVGSTLRDGYVFKGWRTLSGSVVTAPVPAFANEVYTAIYEEGVSTIPVFTVEFSVDGTTASARYERGATPLAPSGVEKEGFTFLGWRSSEDDKLYSSLPAVNANVTYTAEYRSNTAYYTVSFYVDGRRVSSLSVEEGKTPTVSAPQKAGFSFVGWKDSGNNIYTVLPAATSSRRYDAVFEENTVKWTVTLDIDGSAQTLSVTNGAAPELDAMPEKSGFSFVGWRDENGNFHGALPQIYADARFVAVFEIIPQEQVCTVEFIVDGRTVYSRQYAAGQELADPPKAPVKADDDRYTYTFTGWQSSVDGTVYSAVPATVSESVTYTAQFNSKEKPVETLYTVTFVADGKVLSTQSLVRGATPEVPEVPSKEKAVFDGWKDDGGNEYKKDDALPQVKGNVTYTALYITNDGEGGYGEIDNAGGNNDEGFGPLYG